jgi:hypothetical protein
MHSCVRPTAVLVHALVQPEWQRKNLPILSCRAAHCACALGSCRLSGEEGSGEVKVGCFNSWVVGNVMDHIEAKLYMIWVESGKTTFDHGFPLT